jgi:hypothetical protein
MRIVVIALLALNGAASASSGVITPAKTTIQITGLYFLDPSNHTVAVGGSTADGGSQMVGRSITLNASDPDFQSFPFGTLSVPEGRFIGLSLAVDNTQRKVTLDGRYRYMGSDTSSPNQIKNGYYLCSTGTATDGSGIMGSPTPADGIFCAAPAELTIVSNASQANVVSTSFFAKPVCITTTDQQKTVCQPGDNFIDGSNASNLTVTLMFDLFNSMTVANTDPNLGPNQPYRLFPGSYPFAILGDPGAAVHLVINSNLNADGTVNMNGARSIGDVTILMDGSKNLIYTRAGLSSDTMCSGSFVSGCSANNVPGYCSGQSYRMVTATPPGHAPPSPFSDQVAEFDPVKGIVAFEASGYAYGSTQPLAPAGRGLDLIGPIINLTYNTGVAPMVPVNCVADDNASALSQWDPSFQPYLGYAYLAGSGNSYSGAPGYNPNFTLAKVTDPSNLLGTSGSGCVRNQGCGTYPQ